MIERTVVTQRDDRTSSGYTARLKKEQWPHSEMIHLAVLPLFLLRRCMLIEALLFQSCDDKARSNDIFDSKRATFSFFWFATKVGSKLTREGNYNFKDHRSD